MLVVSKLLSLSGNSGGTRPGGGDSFVDRLNCRYTVYLLALFCLLITTKHYIGDPINCWCPAHFTSSHVGFTNSVCWTTGTYYLSTSQVNIPKAGEPKRMIGYYQWVPIMLVLMAILFYLPHVIWTVLNKSAGVAVSTITDAAIESQYKSDSGEREKQMAYITNNMGRVLSGSINNASRHRYRTVRRACLMAHGNNLIAAYIFIKILYLANIIGQIFLLDTFLGIDYHGYGFAIFRRIVDGDDWQTSDRFPRVTLCNLWIRVLGNVHRYTVQCSLPMNLVNEIIFIFIWFWFIFVFIATLCSLLKWAFISLNTGRQVEYTMARLSVINMFEKKYDLENNKEAVTDFVRKFLERDGFLMIRLVSHNTNDATASELLFRLWDYYVENNGTIHNLYRHAKKRTKKDYKEKTPFSGTEGTDLKKRVAPTAPLLSPDSSPDSGTGTMRIVGENKV